MQVKLDELRSRGGTVSEGGAKEEIPVHEHDRAVDPATKQEAREQYRHTEGV